MPSCSRNSCAWPGSRSEPARNARSSIHAGPSGPVRKPGCWASAFKSAIERPVIELDTAVRVHLLLASLRGNRGQCRDRPDIGTRPRPGRMQAESEPSGRDRRSWRAACVKRAGSPLSRPFGQANGLLAHPRLRIFQTQRNGCRIEGCQQIEGPEGMKTRRVRWAAPSPSHREVRWPNGPGARKAAAEPSRATRRRDGQERDQLRRRRLAQPGCAARRPVASV